MMKNLIVLLFVSLALFGCTQSEETPPPPKTGVELIAIGSIKFGNVIIGEYREASIKVINYGPDRIDAFSPTLHAPFSISKISPPCDTGFINSGVTCTVTVKFKPTAKGSFTDTFSLSDKTQDISGTGLDAAGIIDYSVASWDLGTVVSGDSNIKEVSLTNSGDFTVSTPTFDALTGYTQTLNECGSYIAPKRTCKMKFTIIKQGIGTYSESLVFHSADTAPFTITVTSVVIPGPPSGSIVFLNPPSSIVADNADTRTISTSPIRDQFNNIVTDGTTVSVIVNNLTLIGASNKTTVGGVISFDVKSTNQRGDSTITVISGAASGFARFRSLAGPAVGEITAKPYINTVVANGLSQIDIRFNPLRDQFNNVVEDGTTVKFCIRTQSDECYMDGTYAPAAGNLSSGTMISNTSNTVLGESQVTIIPPLHVGTAMVIVQAGTQNNAPPCGWSACGAFPITFVPGQASGVIPVTSTLQGIYADPSSGITANPPETIQTNITIGPVKDPNNNIVATGTPVQIDIVNAIGVISGTSSFTVTTNGSGTASFAIQGIGTRGYIQISAAKDLAAGSTQIWAYGNATLRPYGSSYPNIPFKLSMTYNSVSSDPSPTGGWGTIKNWANIDIQDKNYFGDLKKQAPPTLIASNIPYYVSKCLFSSGNTSYGSACFENNFNDSSLSANTLKITKANTAGDPGASRVDFILNNYPRNIHHQDVPVGCYKMDNAPGSSTQGYLVYYNAPQARCNNQTSSDPESPVYLNDFYPWFGGTWLTNYAFNLGYSATGFLPDIGKALIFGGYYQKATYGGQSNPNSFEVFLSNRHTWIGNFGIDQPFSWIEGQNVDGIFGDYPSAIMAPTMTSSNKDLYMFGGLNFRGKSHTSAGPLLNYIQSTASKNFQVFDGILNKWFSLYPGDDSTLPSNITVKSPTSRYQHGMVFVPDNNKLFVAGGKTVDLNQSFNWFEPNDMWSVDVTDKSQSLEWRRNCSPCGFPANAHNHPANLNPSTINPNPVKMTYNPYLQKVFMLWSGTNYSISSFDPLESDVITVNHNNTYSFSALQSPNLFDMEVNQDIGRTYFYNRKTSNASDSEIYYWDMDSGNKQYLKIETDLGGAPAKTFIRRLSVHVRGYGSIQNSAQAVQGVGGIIVKIYNYTTSSWDLVGTNSAKLDSEDVIGQAVVNTFENLDAKKYVSADGKVTCLLTVRDISNYIGSGYNELKLDEFYVDGLF